GDPLAEGAFATASVISLTSYLLPQHRSTIGPDARHEYVRAPDYVSYGTALVVPGLAMVIGYFVEGASWQNYRATKPWGRAAYVPIIQLESFALAEGLTGAIKATVGRCRPLAWASDKQGCKIDAEDNFAAFPSGHTSGVAAVAGANFVIALR